MGEDGLASVCHHIARSESPCFEVLYASKFLAVTTEMSACAPFGCGFEVVPHTGNAADGVVHDLPKCKLY